MKAAVVALIAIAALLVACEGKTVDREGNRYVDTTHNSYVDTGSGSTIDNPLPQPKETPVVNASEKDFVAPPGNYTENATIDIETKKGFIGKDVVKLWVWNNIGSQSIIAVEGSSVSIPKINVEVKIGPIGHDNDGEVQITVDGKSRILRNRQEVRIGNTWVFISDFFLNAAQ